MSKTRVWGTSGRSISIILRKKVESDRPEVPKTRVLDTSDRPKSPPGGPRAFQRLRKAAPLPHGFAIWQDRAPYASKTCYNSGMGTLLWIRCSRLHKMQVFRPLAPIMRKWPISWQKAPKTKGKAAFSGCDPSKGLKPKEKSYFRQASPGGFWRPLRN